MHRIVVVAVLASCTESPPAELSIDEAALARVTAGRFLDQATFGARPAAGPGALDTLEYVVGRGISGAIFDQFEVPAGVFRPTPPHPEPCDAPFDPARDLGAQFFVDALTAPDQLRLRVMFALHQILVVSELGINEDRGTCRSERRDAMTRYLNALRSGAFGNYRELLESIALEPAMGNYLDMANNVAFDTTGAPIAPNENFARELLQLFTVGTSLLADDGHVIAARPTYSEDQVQAFARTLTGWTYPDPAGCPEIGGKRAPTYTAPMIACNVNHDARQAQLLSYAGAANGGKTTAGAGARAHLEQALDNLFEHPNLPPFVCKQLIQHLVTSNPSRAYVGRVVAVFKDDGAHHRGNLRAVVRAILMDPEARDAPVAAAGRLRAPAELIARIFRSLGTTLDRDLLPGNMLWLASGELGQLVPRAPSVFSYYAPGTPLPATTAPLVGPEFGLLDTGTIAGRANFLHEMLHSGHFITQGVVYDLETLPDTAPALIAWINERWMHGAMSAGLRTTLTDALADPLASTPLRKRQLALYLAAMSPEFQIQR